MPGLHRGSAARSPGSRSGTRSRKIGPHRPRADEVHVAAHDVPELRDLVELRALQEAADRRVEVVLRREQAGADLALRARAERAELVDGEERACPARRAARGRRSGPGWSSWTAMATTSSTGDEAGRAPPAPRARPGASRSSHGIPDLGRRTLGEAGRGGGATAAPDSASRRPPAASMRRPACSVVSGFMR